MRRAILILALIAFLLCAARLTLGPPDLAQVVAFFAGGIPTTMGGESVTILLAWIVVAGAVLSLLGGALHMVDGGQIRRRPSVRAAILLTASLALLIVGAAHHVIPAASVCCGSDAAGIREATLLAR